MIEGFSGINVIDFTTGDSGLICAEYLAMAGMRVIRIDSPHNNSLEEDRYSFIANNLNKHCVTLDVENSTGLELFQRLIEKADVLIENRSNGEMERLGIGYNNVKKLNPRLIYASIKPYAKGSPWQDCPADRFTVSAMSGATYLCGYMGGVPVEPGPDLPDVTSCAFAATGIAAALYQRELTGKGQFLEVSQQDSVIAHSRSAYESFHNNKRNIRVGNAFPTLPDMIPMELFKTKGGADDWVIIGCLGQEMFELLCKAMEMPELITDPRFVDFAARSKNRDEIMEIISEWTSDKDKFKVMDILLRKNRVVCSAVYSLEECINAEDLRSMGFIQKIEDPECGDMWLPAFPAIYSEIEVNLRSPSFADAGDESVLEDNL